MFAWERRIALEPMPGTRASSQVDLGHTDFFLVAAMTSGPSNLVTVFLRTLWSPIKEVKAHFMSDGEHGIALHTMQGNLVSSHGEGEI